MKELTAAQGLLRCGECDTIFDAMKALSTTLPEEREFYDALDTASPTGNTRPADTRIRVLPVDQPAQRQNNHQNIKGASHSKSRKFLILSLAALALLLIMQLLYTSREWFFDHPLTAQPARSLCAAIGCEVPIPQDVSQVKMLSHNVYSHPNLPELLIISAAIQNNADFAQPYPQLEISFLNSDSIVVAFRRFRPSEYMGDIKAKQLMPKGVPEEFSVNISDPGTEAVRFQFRFKKP